MPKLGVNIDHVATLRQARYKALRKGIIPEPDPVKAAVMCENAGCHSIVCHLREDRRHINDRDLEVLRRIVKTRLNLEMSISGKIVKIAKRIKPDQATLVPEKRQEITTEGGLDVVRRRSKIKKAVKDLQASGIAVSLFINPDKKQIKAAKKTGAEFVELHTGEYANAKDSKETKRQLDILKSAVKTALRLKLKVNAGHGLNYLNVRDIARIPGVEELNIGHSIISRAVFNGLDEAVREMLVLVK
jgi:pyridoxine 5-phosphate synthase